MRRVVVAVAISATSMLLGAAGASAATITPTTTQDPQNGSFDDTGCTLRDAIQAANTNASDPNGCNGDNAGADTIVLQGGQTYTLSLHGVDDSNAKGDLDITGPVTIRSSGPGLATIDAASNTFPGPPVGADRAIDVRPSAGSVTLEGLRIQGGFADLGSSIGGGGGILNAAALTVRDSEVVFNQVQGTATTLGGGIYTRGSLGTLTVIGSTIANNKGVALGNANPETVGGGIASYESSPTLTITNSTISGNTVQGSAGINGGPGVVGAIFAGDSGNNALTTLTNVTITGNQALSPGGSITGGLQIVRGTMTGNIIAGNTDPVNLFPDCDQLGTVTSGGGNLIGDPGELSSNCNFAAPNDLVGTHAAPINPNLGTLVDNGGLTKTQVPNSGSPAINRGGTCPATDQRGFLRGPVAPCDAGAVEVGAAPGGSTAQQGGTAGAAPTVVRARTVVRGAVEVKGDSHGRLLVVTGIDASCPDAGGACAGSASINATGPPRQLASSSKLSKSLGKASLLVPSGKTQAVKVKLTAKASNALRSAGALKVTISVSLSAPGGTPAVASRRAKLKPPKPPHHQR